MKKSKLAKFATSEMPSLIQLNVTGGIDCAGLIKVLDHLSTTGNTAQYEAVYQQFYNGGIQGCQPAHSPSGTHLI